MITFINNGELDISQITTFGVSVKENESPIGFFGTGLKYAIAVLLREKCLIEIYSGGKLYEFSVKEKEIRGKIFNIVCCNGIEIGFTTELGRNWKLWHAYRELYSNMLDEKGIISNDDIVTTPEKGQVVIVTKGLEDCYNSHHKYFYVGESEETIKKVEIESVPSDCVFYKKVNILEIPTANTYNILMNVDISEDRVAKYQWEVRDILARAIFNSTNKKIIKQAICSADTFEESFEYACISGEPSQEFKEVALAHPEHISKNLLQKLKRYDFVPEEYAPTVKEQLDLEYALCLLSWIKEVGFDRNKYKIEFVQKIDNDQNILGTARNNKIILSKYAFEWNLPAIILEEYLHLETGYSDFTRSFQDYLFNLIIKIAKEQYYAVTV